MLHCQQYFLLLIIRKINIKKIKYYYIHTGLFPREEQSDPWHCLMCSPYFYLSSSSERVASTWPPSFENFKCLLQQSLATREPLARGVTPSLQVLITVFIRAVATVLKIFECLVLYLPYESCHLVPFLLNMKFFRDMSHKSGNICMLCRLPLNYITPIFISFAVICFKQTIFLQGKMENILPFTLMEQSFSSSFYLSIDPCSIKMMTRLCGQYVLPKK